MSSVDQDMKVLVRSLKWEKVLHSGNQETELRLRRVSHAPSLPVTLAGLGGTTDVPMLCSSLLHLITVHLSSLST